MMLKFKSLTIKNFQSIGSITQTIKFDNDTLTLVLGENMDLGGSGNRNGTGKTTIANALSFGLFGQAISNVRKDNMINVINKKNMMVCVEFEKDGHSYRIERGRRPNVFKFIVDNNIVNAKDTDEAQGESRDTQAEINHVLSFSHQLFKQLICLNTYTIPFLNLTDSQQREIIEELLGITQLSEKAEALRELLRETKDQIDRENVRIATIKESNDRIKRSIEEIEQKETRWQTQKDSKIATIQEELETLLAVDIDTEIATIKMNDEYKPLIVEAKSIMNTNNKIVQDNRSRNATLVEKRKKLEKEITQTEEHNCPMCGHDLHEDQHERILAEQQAKLKDYNDEIDQNETKINDAAAIVEEQKEIIATLSEGVKKTDTYANLEDALKHKNRIDRLTTDLETAMESENPHSEHIKTLKSQSLQDINYDTVNELVVLREHQDFLLKMLTAKDSSLRKKIIEQNISYLNSRLSHYLDKLGLAYIIKFLSDLTVQITQLGNEFDYDQLSRGERTRVTLALSWSFRDVYESMTQSMNLMFVDELLDQGLDPIGVENSFEVLKKMQRDRKKNIFIVSHREELIQRVSNVLLVVKENGFTTLNSDSSQNVDPEGELEAEQVEEPIAAE